MHRRKDLHAALSPCQCPSGHPGDVMAIAVGTAPAQVQGISSLGHSRCSPVHHPVNRVTTDYNLTNRGTPILLPRPPLG